MNILKFNKFLEEVELNLAELGKPIGSQKRGDVLVKKIKSAEDLSLNNNKPLKVSKMKNDDGSWTKPSSAIVDITTDGEYDVDKAKNVFTKNGKYQLVFKDAEGDEFKLNQIKKTAEFGSKGAGVSTQKFETIQCIFLGIKQAFPEVNLNQSNLKTFWKKYISVGETLVYTPERVQITEDLVDEFSSDANWSATFCRIPNRLWSGSYVNTNLLYKIFHASYKGEQSTYVQIEKKFKEFAKIEKFIDINISKFCPADVYLVSQVNLKEINSQIDSTRSINELVDLMNKLFDNKLLIPISLKKIAGNFKIITNSEVGKELPDFYVKTFHFGSDMKGISSKISTTSLWKHRAGKDVDVKDRKINFDSSDTSKKVNVDGEVEGSASRHGKISFSSIKRIIQSSIQDTLTPIQTYDELSRFSIDDLKSLFRKLMNEIQNRKKEFGAQVVKVSPILRGTDISNNQNKLISRIQSMQINLAILQIYAINQKIANSVITKIMRYALSIQTDKFSTPRYLRII